MARGVNKVILVGHVGKDPEIRYFQNGGAVTNLTLATSEAWSDKTTGEKKEKTEWHKVSITGKLAEIIAKYAKKGTSLYVEGKLVTRKWQDQNGQDRYSTEVLVDFNGTVQLLSGKQDGENKQPEAPQQAKPKSNINTSMMTPEERGEPPVDFDDDIPW